MAVGTFYYLLFTYSMAVCLLIQWLLKLVVLIDDTKLLVLSGTMQYKVHEWYIKRMNG